MTPTAETCLVNDDHMCNNQHVALSYLGPAVNSIIEIKSTTKKGGVFREECYGKAVRKKDSYSSIVVK